MVNEATYRVWLAVGLATLVSTAANGAQVPVDGPVSLAKATGSRGTRADAAFDDSRYSASATSGPPGGRATANRYKDRQGREAGSVSAVAQGGKAEANVWYWVQAEDRTDPAYPWYTGRTGKIDIRLKALADIDDSDPTVISHATWSLGIGLLSGGSSPVVDIQDDGRVTDWQAGAPAPFIDANQFRSYLYVDASVLPSLTGEPNKRLTITNSAFQSVQSAEAGVDRVFTLEVPVNWAMWVSLRAYADGDAAAAIDPVFTANAANPALGVIVGGVGDDPQPGVPLLDEVYLDGFDTLDVEWGRFEEMGFLTPGLVPEPGAAAALTIAIAASLLVRRRRM
jgi:hypothetical protein